MLLASFCTQNIDISAFALTVGENGGIHYFKAAIFKPKILPMDFQTFTASLKNDTPPTDLQPLLKALWYDAQGDWHKAHDIAQDVHSNDGSWIHAYLHRKEGDKWNANYWYRRAGRSMPSASLEEEWENISRALLEK